MAGAAEAVRARDFGAWLQSWRHDQRLTQRELATTLGYDVTYVAKIEGGARAPSQQFLARLAQVTGQRKETLLHASTQNGARSALPCPPDLLIGRDADAETVVSMLTGPARCVTLVGPPGIGKTRLAMEVAHRLDGRFLSGACWVPLLDVVNVDEVPAHIERALGVVDCHSDDAPERLIQHVASQHVLLVLDNVEHLIGVRHLVSRLIGEAPRVAVLATSREPLDLLAEHLYAVPPLEWVDPGSSSLQEIASSSAVELFATRALMAFPHFRLTPAVAPAVARACAQLDGIPLAIVLAAGLVRTTDPVHIDEAVDDHLGHERPGPADLAPNHGTLSSAIAASWRLLSAEEQTVFARLAVFAGGCTTEAAEAVCGTPDAWRHLASLSRQSLLEARPDAPGGPRFGMLETIRRFAAARLEESGETGVVHRRRLDYFLAFAREAGRRLLGAGQLDATCALAAEFPNIRASFEWALIHCPADALVLAERLWRFLLMRDIPTAWRWLESALARAPEPTADRAAALAAAGSIAWVTGKFEEASRCLTEAMDLATRWGRTDVEALAMLNGAALADQLGKLDEADQAFAGALCRYDAIGDRRGRANVLVGQGWIRRKRGDVDGAWPLWIEAAAIFRAIGDSYNEVKALSNLEWASEHRGDLAEAEEWVAECRRVHLALGDVRGLAIDTGAMGRIAFSRGLHRDAADRLLDAATAFHELGERRRCVESLVYLAAVEDAERKHHRALRLIGAAEAELDRLGAALDDELHVHESVVASCRRRLDEGAARRALAYGRSLSVERALDLAADAPAAATSLR